MQQVQRVVHLGRIDLTKIRLETFAMYYERPAFLGLANPEVDFAQLRGNHPRTIPRSHERLGLTSDVGVNPETHSLPHLERLHFDVPVVLFLLVRVAGIHVFCHRGVRLLHGFRQVGCMASDRSAA